MANPIKVYILARESSLPGQGMVSGGLVLKLSAVPLPSHQVPSVVIRHKRSIFDWRCKGIWQALLPCMVVLIGVNPLWLWRLELGLNRGIYLFPILMVYLYRHTARVFDPSRCIGKVTTASFANPMMQCYLCITLL